MSPNETLARIRELTAKDANDGLSIDEIDELVSSIRDLDEWLSKGGFLPVAWTSSVNILGHPATAAEPPKWRQNV